MTMCPAVTISKGKILLSPKGLTGLANLNQSAIAKDQTTLNLTASFIEPKNKLETEPVIKVVDEIKEKKKVEFSPAKKHSIKASSSKSNAKKRKDYSYKRKRGQEKEQKNSADYLTPIDFIHLIRTDPEMTDEFCYLNKRSHPYDFQIVDFNERNPEEYMTISARVKTIIWDF
jgi:dynein heavy chain